MALSDIRIVLTRPKYGGNVGSVCRAMMNMGLSKLVLVDPSPEITDLDVRRFALRAEPLWPGADRASDPPQTVADCATVLSTTARDGRPTAGTRAQPPRRRGVPLLPESDNAPAAIVFGPEDHGLSNDELKLATTSCRSSTPEFSSLNLSRWC
ncbi:MAG: RNA methyltransferase [Kiritimatiellia bacterium]